MKCRGTSSSWKLFLLLHAPQQSKQFHTLDTIVEEPNEVNSIGAENESEHRCEFLRHLENHTKTEDKNRVNFENRIYETVSQVDEENQSYQQKEKGRKQWETSPDQIKEITRSLSQINESNFDKSDQEVNHRKTSVSNKLLDNQVNRQLLPPINTLSDSDSGKEPPHTCVCEGIPKSNGDFKGMDKYNNIQSEPQWVVTRPKRTKPKDNLRLEGSMEMETTFKTTIDSTAKQINDNLSKNMAVVMNSSKISSDENLLQTQRQTKLNHSNEMRSSKKKSKVRPSTSLKAGGDGYFNTISKESYKNFVIIDDNCKGKSNRNGNRKQSVCCSTVANIKLPKVNTINNKSDKQLNGKQSKELKSIEMEQMNSSMHKMTTEDNKVGLVNDTTHRSEQNSDTLIKSSVKAQNNSNGIENGFENSKQEVTENFSTKNLHKSDESEKVGINASKEGESSWTVGHLEETKRLVTRDVDNIKELGILDGQPIRSRLMLDKEFRQMSPHREVKETNINSNITNGSTRIRIESKHYVKPQTRQKKHKNEGSMKLFQGDMDFLTTSKTSYSDNSPNRSRNTTESVPIVRKHTAGKKTLKSGKKRNLFRTSTEAEFCQKLTSEKTSETTYQKQFDDRLYCPALDLGSDKSDFKYKGESSGHKFFLPAVKY